MSAGGGAGGGSGGGAASRAPPPAPGGNGGAARPYDMFISYAHEDGKDVAALLEYGLTCRGLRVWRDETRLSAGDTIHDEISRGLASSSHMVAVITPAYLKRASPLMELGAVVYGNHVGRIIPVLHGTRHLVVERTLPALAGRYMKAWDGNSERIAGEIAEIVEGHQQTNRLKLAQYTRCGVPGEDAIRVASIGAAASIPQEINGTTMDRSGQVATIEGLLESVGRVAVVGDKGSGKSVLSCLLYEGLAARGAALLVRCDDFLGAESAEYLDKEIVPGHSLTGLVAASAAAGGMTIIFDSLDAAGRDERTMRAFRRLLELVWGAGARTVVAVRSYDYEHSGAIATTDWGGKYELGPLSDDELDGMLRDLGGPPVPPRLRGMLSNPLNLHLFSLLLKKSHGVDLESIDSEIDLYDAHWHYHVELDPLCGRVRDALYDIAEEMSRARKTLVPPVPGDVAAATQVQSSGILVRTGDGSGVRYFHHAYMDYVMSRALLERHQPVEEYLRADEYNMFLRPTLSLALVMARKRDPGEFATAVEGILRADIKYHWKIVALESLASVAPEGRNTYARLKTLLTDQPVLQRHFLMALTRHHNASWLLAWGNTLHDWAADFHVHNGPHIIDYLEAAAAADGRCHGAAFAVIRVLAGAGGDGLVRKRAVAALAGIDAEGGTGWLKSMSKSDDPRVRAGVALTLPRLLERDPDAVPEIFSNMYAYEETSTEETDMFTYGHLRMTSTKARDNDINRRVLADMFPRLMDANPPVMVRALVLAAERVNRGNLSCPGTGFVDDSPRGPWYMEFHEDGSSPLVCIAKYMASCADEDFSRLIPPLEGTRLALLRSLLIDRMTRRKPAFLGKLADLLSDPRMHEARALEHIVRRAIGDVGYLLDDGQRGRILGAMGGPGTPRGEPGGSAKAGGGGGAPPAIASALPRAAPLAGRLPPARGSSRRGAEDAAPGQGPGFQALAEGAGGPDPAALIEGMLDHYLDRDGRISLLERVLSVLDGRPGDLGEDLVSRITAFLVGSRRDVDPAVDNAPAAGPGGAPAAARSVRGLAAECLIRIAARREDAAVLGAIRELSEDPSGAVRCSVAGSLELLLPAHYGTARAIAMSYSRDPDERVRSALPAVIRRIAEKDPAAASAMVGNVLESPARPPHGIASLLLWLAMVRGDARSAEMLRRIAGEGAFARELRMEIPFVLREEYLASAGHRDEALGLLLALLDDPDRGVRYHASFFTLNGFDDNPAIDNREYIRGIALHLGRVLPMLEERPFDPGIAEALAWFLEKFWKDVPETALSFLEKTVRIYGVSAAPESTIADSALTVLAGLLQYHSLYDGEWNRCVDVLDTYAAAGWPIALDLLASMGERG